jgi:hypothetical protein
MISAPHCGRSPVYYALNSDDGFDRSRQVWSFSTSPQVPLQLRPLLNERMGQSCRPFVPVNLEFGAERFLIAEMGTAKRCFDTSLFCDQTKQEFADTTRKPS